MSGDLMGSAWIVALLAVDDVGVGAELIWFDLSIESRLKARIGLGLGSALAVTSLAPRLTAEAAGSSLVVARLSGSAAAGVAVAALFEVWVAVSQFRGLRQELGVSHGGVPRWWCRRLELAGEGDRP